VGAGTAAFGCALLVPGVKLLAAPLKSGGAGERWVRTVKLDDLREGEPRKVEIVADARDAWSVASNVQLGAAWLVRRGKGVVAFNVTCPHLGCSVNVVPGTKAFACPCHTSAFGADGKRQAGPSPRDLDELQTRVDQAGYVEVDFRKYRIGVGERVEIG
jgi:Rieske Fe-S protein